ncbi:peroxidase family protein [Candidatus Poriferisocius sp.]|uniref:peroxidase family protein n=1 Tax=Candidatus Poriferisocius sp. TaxID=3101276 RepID=UPI003B0293DA
MSCSLFRHIAASAIALVVLAAGLAPVMSTAGAQASEVEVRIAARRLDGGQLEFALQKRNGRSWGERRRPDQHYFPVDLPEWLDSTALTIEAIGQVRISARLSDDGRVEFTLQQQQADTTWGERLLAQRRFFPVATSAGIWLVTSPLTISAPAPAPEPAVEPEADEQEEVMVCLAAREVDALTVSATDGTPFENRSMNGEGNNAVYPTWGMAGTALLKLAPNSYADGVSAPTTSRPNPRTISNLVFAQDESVPNSSRASDITWQWGQFIDHDISLSLNNNEEPFPISVPRGDPIFDPRGTGQTSIHLDRSVFDPATGTDRLNPRQQINALTALIDGSQVYGSDDDRAQALRTNDGTGRLKTSHDGRFLPYNERGLDNEGGSHLTNLFIAGDLRVNEQIGLISMHTLFVREHNRLADIIAALDPSLTGDDIYQLARKIVGAQIQAITFNEFLPLLLGPDAIGPYSGYDPSVNPAIASEFSAAAYRVGHTLLSPDLLLLNADGEKTHISLAQAFFNPSHVEEHGISAILLGSASQSAQEVDSLIIGEVRNMLLRGPVSPAFDLAALNIQRGRDHGVGDLNTVRRAFGLSPVESFADISSDPDVQQALQEAYGGVDDLDLWVAALAEDHVPGALVGQTLQTIISNQFRRLRNGDRFWYENDPFFSANPELLDHVRGITLANVIRCNTPIEEEIQDNAFIVKES